MQVERLWLEQFRNYVSAELEFAPDGLTAIVGGNGQGKTNLLEALGVAATLKSFRGAPTEALIGRDAESAIVRLEGHQEERRLLVEIELSATGRNRSQLNKQPVKRTRDLRELLHITVFSPDDLVMLKGGPGERRRYVDDLLADIHLRNEALQTDFDRILRQRNTLLRQSGGRLSDDVASTLDVWDAKLTETGSALVAARRALLERIEPMVAKSYADLAATGAVISTAYVTQWGDDLGVALANSRTDDLRRGVTTVGPHRDDVVMSIDGLSSRTHASQGEQRTLALALRLAAHAVVGEETETTPLLLLDDVFSELDPERSDALVAHLPAGQAILTTAGALPAAIRPERTLHIRDGAVAAL